MNLREEEYMSPEGLIEAGMEMAKVYVVHLPPEDRTVGLDTDGLKILLKQIENQLHERESELLGRNTHSNGAN